MTETVHYTYTRAPKVAWGWGLMTLSFLLRPLSALALAARGRPLPEKETVLGSVRDTVLLAGIFVSPFFTRHELRADRLVLRQGLNFGGSIRYSDIAAVHATERTATGLPLRLYPHTLFLTLWPVNLVAIRLRRPQRFRLLHLLPGWKVREVVINVDRRDAFIADLRNRVAESAAAREMR
ncbi:MAG TPA: hypothetical protein VN837_06435 [Chloroflexota bacterium]|nr:hypothetical protein [Chloroflexota bacterium]